MAFDGFGKNSGPSVPPRTSTPFGNLPSQPSPPIPNPNPNPFDKKSLIAAVQPPPRRQQTPPKQERPLISPNWGNQPKQLVNPPYSASQKRLSPVAASGTAYDAEAIFPTKPVNLHDAKRTSSPSFPSQGNTFLETSNPVNTRRPGTHLDMRLDYGTDGPSKRTRGLPTDFESSHSVQNYGFSQEIARRRDVSPSKVGSQKKSPVNIADFSSQQRSHTIGSSPARDAADVSLPMPAYFSAPKRARSPTLSPPDIPSAASSAQLDSEREIQAKAKRLARFNIELSQPLQTKQALQQHKFSGSKHNQTPLDKQKNADILAEESQDLAVSDYEGPRSTAVVVGLCPDMCPEPEREERERKGDLDKYERLDGERNQTSEFLAVKKYNRTAERDADLIRPMPVLQKTIDYLLNLLDQPYDENFLGIYNFLWDRMRSIRMDLRMQHIFNREAIVMLEQMIRLHIIAMHELCEYKKGEGFSEGFDAHLNIEQMNKTSVELFQMYEDHRKKGISIPTEKEFRGYYALLKLDKHPGYKVEPAELSLDLAKMTPEVRRSREILFARDVARACRIGNYITFFRLARKATYLQACLMHAHFAKLRTQALICLHSGLQNSQGIPISHVIKWLGMEGEDMENLLEYYGFSLRRYEEIYMVKEGPFLNSDIDYPTKCSQLVHHKRSRCIVDDVKFGPVLSQLTDNRAVSDSVDMVDQRIKPSNMVDQRIKPSNMVDQRIKPSKTKAWINVVDEFVVDEEMLDFKADPVPRAVSQPQQLVKGPSPAERNRENDFVTTDVSHIVRSGDDHDMTEIFPVEPTCLLKDDSIINQEQHVQDEQVIGFAGLVGRTFMDQSALPIPNGSAVQAGVLAISNSNCIVVNPAPQTDLSKNLEREASALVPRQKDVAFREKLKLILRKWKNRSSVLREIREQREFLANAALSSLSLGPPILQQTESCLSQVDGELNIDYAARERHGRWGKSWGRLNTSKLIAPILSMRNPDAKCLCWKLVFLIQANETESQAYNLASRWLLAKLMGTGTQTDDDLVVSSPGLSVWKTWIGTNTSPLHTCCLSFIRVIKGDNNQPVNEDILAGSSCLLFLVSKNIPWDVQRAQLHKLLSTVPSGSSLPLLILDSGSFKEDVTDASPTILNRLGLHEADKMRISSSSVIFLTGRDHMEPGNCFFDDGQLRAGLQWLANHSPLQPLLRLVKTRELVLGYLRHSVEVLDRLKATEVSPDHCILVFNEVLDRCAEEITVAASTNSKQWPCPEINLLDKSSTERFLADICLPGLGWSAAERIEPIIRAIKGCRLPSFPNDLSWLNQGCPMGREIQNQKSAIEECLISYLTRSTHLLNDDLAAREANVMLQKGAGLELRGSCYHIIIRWSMIFRRIFNWRLMRLTGKEVSEAYVLDRADESVSPSLADTVKKGLENDFRFEGLQQLHSVQTDLSFDELVEISCNVPCAGLQPIPVLKPLYSPLDIHDGGGCASEVSDGGRESNEDDLRCKKFSCDASLTVDRDEQSKLSELGEKDSRLSVLLEQCSMLQDVIDRKLAIYF